MEKADQLLQGAFDMHAHGYPEYTLHNPPRLDGVEWAKLAVNMGLGGFVIKSHVWPTTTEAYLLSKSFPQIHIYGSITLNTVVGGLDPLSAEIAGECGAKVVFMPTWTSKNDRSRGGIYTRRMRQRLSELDNSFHRTGEGLTVLDENGELLDAAIDIIKICSKYDMVLASGHLTPAESMALCDAARSNNTKFVVSHPLSKSVGMSLEDQVKIAQKGGFIEHVFIGAMPMHQRMDPHYIVEAIEAVGPEHCIISSDAIEAWNPPQPEVLRMFIATLLSLGVKDEAIYEMTHTNPAKLLGIKELPKSE